MARGALVAGWLARGPAPISAADEACAGPSAGSTPRPGAGAQPPGPAWLPPVAGQSALASSADKSSGGTTLPSEARPILSQPAARSPAARGWLTRARLVGLAAAARPAAERSAAATADRLARDRPRPGADGAPGASPAGANRSSPAPAAVAGRAPSALTSGPARTTNLEAPPAPAPGRSPAATARPWAEEDETAWVGRASRRRAVQTRGAVAVAGRAGTTANGRDDTGRLAERFSTTAGGPFDDAEPASLPPSAPLLRSLASLSGPKLSACSIRAACVRPRRRGWQQSSLDHGPRRWTERPKTRRRASPGCHAHHPPQSGWLALG